MSRFRFELATEADDADLRQVLRESPMEGRIRVAFLREPSWFAAAAIDGSSLQVVACRDSESGRIIGFGCRSIRRLFVHGEERSVGYLGSLRLLPEFRRRGLVARGYAFFRELHADGRADFYLTTIAAGNAPALETLARGRAGLPKYVPAGEYFTLAIPLRLEKRAVHEGIRAATAEDWARIVEFLRREGPKRQFFPTVGRQDFQPEQLSYRSLDAKNVLLAERKGDIKGVLGGWDQSAYKQTVVLGYKGMLGWALPGVNLWARLRGMPPLPLPGEAFDFLTAALPVVKDNSPEVLKALFEGAAMLPAAKWRRHLLVGMHVRDPLLATAKRLAVARYTTLLYLVGWDEAAILEALKGDRVPYLELGKL